MRPPARLVLRRSSPDGPATAATLPSPPGHLEPERTCTWRAWTDGSTTNYLQQCHHLLRTDLAQQQWPWKGDGRSDFMHWLCVLDCALLKGELRRKKAAGKDLKIACSPLYFFWTVFGAGLQCCMILCWDSAIAMPSHLTRYEQQCWEKQFNCSASQQRGVQPGSSWQCQLWFHVALHFHTKVVDLPGLRRIHVYTED